MSTQIVKCRHEACGADLVFMVTAKGRRMPVDLSCLHCTLCGQPHEQHQNGEHQFEAPEQFIPGAMVSHFGTCKSAAQFRKGGR